MGMDETQRSYGDRRSINYAAQAGAAAARPPAWKPMTPLERAAQHRECAKTHRKEATRLEALAKTIETEDRELSMEYGV